jgi:hypothetical protein
VTTILGPSVAGRHRSVPRDDSYGRGMSRDVCESCGCQRGTSRIIQNARPQENRLCARHAADARVPNHAPGQGQHDEWTASPPRMNQTTPAMRAGENRPVDVECLNTNPPANPPWGPATTPGRRRYQPVRDGTEPPAMGRRQPRARPRIAAVITPPRAARRARGLPRATSQQGLTPPAMALAVLRPTVGSGQRRIDRRRP